MFETLKNLNRVEIDVYINVIMTLVNENNIESLIEYLINFENIKKIQIGAAGFSLYKGEKNYLQIRSSLGRVRQIQEFINKLKENLGKRIFLNFQGYFTKEDFLTNETEKEKTFKGRVRCSGNFTTFTILPDGKVTICEELYWHPRFIIGDIMKQSIEEVWNSERALELYNISKNMIREESPCKQCEEFEKCHKLKGVCWKQILYAYGYENWDYPDPSCPKAPMPKRVFWIE